VLLQAGIEHTDGLAVVTGSDDTDVVLARLARQVFRVPRVVARLHDPHQHATHLGEPTPHGTPLLYSPHHDHEFGEW
jgi:Trk K+ transport system NAD-binding subunit